MKRKILVALSIPILVFAVIGAIKFKQAISKSELEVSDLCDTATTRDLLCFCYHEHMMTCPIDEPGFMEKYGDK